jgi:very-short-patch-repair endonuclease
MPKEPGIAIISGLAATNAGVFRGRDVVCRGVKRERLRSLALLWAGDMAAAAGRSAAEIYRLEGVRAPQPEIVLPHDVRGRMNSITTYHGEPRALMVRTVDGIRVTGVEATLMRLASTLEVMARRLLVLHGITDFVREYPLDWDGRTYFYDFAFPHHRVILETNGRRWHDDATDYERDQEKRSVPGRHGYRLVFATWQKVSAAPGQLLGELTAAIAA